MPNATPLVPWDYLDKIMEVMSVAHVILLVVDAQSPVSTAFIVQAVISGK